MKFKYTLPIPLIPSLIIIFLGCRKFVEVNTPSTQLASVSVYSNNTTASAALTGIYNKMSSGNLASGKGSIGFLSGLSSDELQNYSSDPVIISFYKNSLTSTNASAIWSESYQYIYAANSAIEGLSNSQSVSQEIKQQLFGEAKFIRAFCNFYLLNLYGDIPLITTTDYRKNAGASRTPQSQVYEQIISDLKEAQEQLKVAYVDADIVNTTLDRIRPNKWAATALLARAYLYKKEWANAAAEATKIINNETTYSLANDLDSVFLANSQEAIWQLQPVTPGYNTFDGYYYILTSDPGYFRPASLSTYLQQSFEVGDKRATHWIGNYNGYYYPYKYKVQLGSILTEYIMVFRLAEQYLIRAEARAELNNISGAASDLNIIRKRSGLPNISPAMQTNILPAIQKERRVELFTEWGHRWLDLKRTERVDAVMAVITPQKGGTWNTNWQLYPIPLSEIQNNPNITQNAGY